MSKTQLLNFVHYKMKNTKYDPLTHVFQAISVIHPELERQESTRGLHHLKLPVNSRWVNLASLPAQNSFLLHHQTCCDIALAVFLLLEGHDAVFQLHEHWACTKAFSLLSCSDNKTCGSRTFSATAFKSGPALSRRHLLGLLSLCCFILLLFLCLPPLLFYLLVSPFGNLQMGVILCTAPPSRLFRLEGGWRSLADPDFGDDKSRPDAAPSEQVEWQEARFPRGYCAHLGHGNADGLQAGSPLLLLGDHRHSGVLEELLVAANVIFVLRSDLLCSLLPEDFLHSQSAFPHTRWAAWAHSPARQSNEGTSQTCCHLHHVVKDPVLFRAIERPEWDSGPYTLRNLLQTAFWLCSLGKKFLHFWPFWFILIRKLFRAWPVHQLLHDKGRLWSSCETSPFPGSQSTAWVSCMNVCPSKEEEKQLVSINETIHTPGAVMRGESGDLQENVT